MVDGFWLMVYGLWFMVFGFWLIDNGMVQGFGL